MNIYCLWIRWKHPAQLCVTQCLAFPVLRSYHAVIWTDNVTSANSVTQCRCRLLSDSAQHFEGHNPDVKTATLYVHWPYCQRRCSYCNFNKYINRNVDHERMRKCLVMETSTLLKLSRVEKITSIFFGGGTPSLAEPETIYSVVKTVKDMVHFSNEGEVTLEVNPTIVEKEHLRDFKSAGINRVSVGVQTLDSKGLAVLGRDHTVESALECVQDARALFPGRVSVDMIFGYPGHGLSAWTDQLQQLLQICDKHISLYQLTLERGTQLFKMVQKGSVNLPHQDELADMYRTAVQVLKDNGFKRYEVSNFAKESRYSSHNLAYWEGKQYIGVGPGAHGRFVVQSETGSLERHARIQTLEPDNWMWEVERFSHATRKIVKQSKIDILEEMLALGLRTCWGLCHERWNQQCPQLSLYIFNSGVFLSYCSSDLLQLDDRGLRATPEGINVLDSIVPDLFLQLHQALAR